ncbi:hypothetical protein B7494_g5572 [Chlorociboria aeruginascens]|nr:hypothetical protein B7494_g5572 [Chlorociboria aeruginascens]
MTRKHPKKRSSKGPNLGTGTGNGNENVPPKSEEPTKPLQTFSLFPLLPAELRLKIYHYATLPRLIHLSPPCKTTVIPLLDPLLHTCGTSRHETQRAYITTSAPLPLSLNPSFDTVFLSDFRDAGFLTSLEGSGLWSHVRYLAVGTRFWSAVLGRAVLGRRREARRALYAKVRNARFLTEIRIVDEWLGSRKVPSESLEIGDAVIVDLEYGGFEGAERWVRCVREEGQELEWVRNTKARIWESWDREVGFVMQGEGTVVPDVKFARLDGVSRKC